MQPPTACPTGNNTQSGHRVQRLCCPIDNPYNKGASIRNMWTHWIPTYISFVVWTWMVVWWYGSSIGTLQLFFYSFVHLLYQQVRQSILGVRRTCGCTSRACCWCIHGRISQRAIGAIGAIGAIAASIRRARCWCTHGRISRRISRRIS